MTPTNSAKDKHLNRKNVQSMIYAQIGKKGMGPPPSQSKLYASNSLQHGPLFHRKVFCNPHNSIHYCHKLFLIFNFELIENQSVTTSIIQITRADINDLHVVQQLASTTFYESFAAMNTAADMNKYLAENFTTEKISTELNDPFSEWYIAQIDQTPVGYLKINFGSAQTEMKDMNALEIERIYVLKAFHGNKIGQQLFDKAVDIAKTRNASYLWLGVWEHNQSALAFYTKNGLVPFDKHLFMLGDDRQTDILMKRQL